MELSFSDKALLILSIQTTIQAVKTLDADFDRESTLAMLWDLNERLSTAIKQDVDEGTET